MAVAVGSRVVRGTSRLGQGPRGRHRLAVAVAVALATFGLVAAVLGLGGTQPLGAGDNGDGARLYRCAGLAPATADGRAAWVGGVVVHFRPVAPCAESPAASASSALVLLRLSTLGAGSDYDLGRLGILDALLLAVAGGAGAWAAAATRLRRAAVVAVPLAPVGLPAFGRFFVSTFTEPAGLLGVAVAGCGVAAVLATPPSARSARAVALALLLLGGLTAGLAKPSYLPVLALCLLGAAAVRVGRARWPSVAAAALVGLLAALPATAALHDQRGSFATVNTDNIVFTLVLPEVGPDRAVAALGLPPSAAAASGLGYYAAVVDDPGSIDMLTGRADAVRAASYRLLAEHPAALLRAGIVGLRATSGAGLDYLPSGPPTGPIDHDERGWSGAEGAPFRRVLDAQGPAWAPFAVLVLVAAVVVAAPRLGAGGRRWALGAAAAAVSALAVVAAAVLGDGYYEVFKHVWLAAYLLLVAALCVTGAAATALVATVRDRDLEAFSRAVTEEILRPAALGRHRRGSTVGGSRRPDDDLEVLGVARSPQYDAGRPRLR